MRKERVEISKNQEIEEERVENYTHTRAQKKRKYFLYITIFIIIILLLISVFFNVALVDDYSGCSTGLTGVKVVVFRRIYVNNLTNRNVYYYWNSEHLVHIFGVSIASETVKADNGTHIAFHRNCFNQTIKKWYKYLKWESKSIIAGEFLSQFLIPFSLSNILFVSLAIYTKKNSKVWLDRLSLFLGCYMIISYYWAIFTNTGNPFFWTLFVVFPSVGIYVLFKWLWSK